MQIMPIARHNLTDGGVQKLSAQRRTLPHQRKVGRRKDHRIELTGKLCRAVQRDLIEADGLCPLFSACIRLIQLDAGSFLPQCALKHQVGAAVVLSKANHLPVLGSTETFCTGKHPDCFG
jgi:hypothetical protein